METPSNAVTHGMKAKSIKSIIRRKVDGWLDTIEDKDLKDKLKQGVIVTGGAIASMLVGEPINDFDIYFRNHDLTLAVAKYCLARFKPKKKAGIEVPLTIHDDGTRIKVVAKSAGIASESGSDKPYEYFEGSPDERTTEYVGEIIDNPEQIEDVHQETEKKALAVNDEKDKPKHRPVFMTSNAITLSGQIQLILRFYGEPDDIHANYDFVHCTNYWQSWDGELVLRPGALESLLARELRYVGSKYPICSVVRLRKFIERGWRVNAGQILKMAMQISELNLKDLKVLEDQLTGVDTAYFVQLIERLKEKDPEKVDTAYLVEIIDRIF
jgi:hypothetical protein